MIDSVALRAPTSPPDTGASMLTTPRCRGLLGNLHRQRRPAGRHVHQHAARRAAGQRAVLAQQHVPHVFRKADDREHHVRRGGHVARRIGPAGAALDQLGRLRLGSREDRRLVTGVNEMAAHRPAHHAGADPADTCCLRGDLHPVKITRPAAGRRSSASHEIAKISAGRARKKPRPAVAGRGSTNFRIPRGRPPRRPIPRGCLGR